MFKVTNKNIRTDVADVFIVNFEHIPHFILVFLLLTLSKLLFAGFRYKSQE